MQDQLSSQARSSLSEYLQLYPWSFWFTATSKDKDSCKYPTVALKRAAGALSGFDRGFIGAETHLLGGWHTHGLVFSSADIGAKEAVKVVLEERLSRYGFCKVDYIRRAADVCAYVSKYITKERCGEWELVGRESWKPKYRYGPLD